MNDQELEDTYGPAAKYSDHQRGEHIKFVEEGNTYSGIIIWVCAPEKIADKQIPTVYIVAGDQQQGFPHVVYPSDIIEPR